MRIAILGMGKVGTTLGRRWRNAGHNIVFGVRNPEERRAEATELKAEVGTASEAVASAGAVLLAVPWTAAPDVLHAAGDLLGKVLLDWTTG